MYVGLECSVGMYSCVHIERVCLFGKARSVSLNRSSLHLLRQILLLHPGLADFASLGSQFAPRISCLSFQSLLGLLAHLSNESGALST